MLSEQEYRKALDAVLNIPKGNGANWNNDFILALAFNGLILLPLSKSSRPPFSHYGMAPQPIYEIQKDGSAIAAWTDSWIVDGDYEDHLKKEVAVFNFTPLRK